MTFVRLIVKLPDMPAAFADLDCRKAMGGIEGAEILDCTAAYSDVFCREILTPPGFPTEAVERFLDRQP